MTDRAGEHLLLGDDGADQGGSVPKLETGIPGFDLVTMGGLPRRRATVLAGQAGSAKTVFAAHFLAAGIRRGQPGVFVSLEEPAADLRVNLRTLGFDVPAWEQAGDWRFVDASPVLRTPADGPTPYSLETLAAQIGHAVDATGAERLVIDSLDSILALHAEPAVARQLLRRLVSDVRAMGLTVILTVETPHDPGGTLTRYGIEEFVADSVVLLRNLSEGKGRRRTLEVLKMRGALHRKGDVAFTVLPGRGVVVLPVDAPHPSPNGGESRVTTGNPELDTLCSGGFFRGSTTLVTGPTGTGKTLTAMSFLSEGARLGERVLMVAYEETREQVLRNARSWALDFAGAEQRGLLRLEAVYPEVASLDDHLVRIQDLVTDHQPDRVVVDAVSALERLGSVHSYREFVVGLTSYVRQMGVATLITASAPNLSGGNAATEGHVSGLIDALVLLRYVETRGVLRRGLVVLKQRGSAHGREIREFTISDSGMSLGQPLSDVQGILTGQSLHTAVGAP